VGTQAVFETRPITMGGNFNGNANPFTVDVTTHIAVDLRIDNLIVSTDDVAPVDISVDVFDLVNNQSRLVTITLPAGAGTTPGVPAVDILADIPASLVGVPLAPDCKLSLTTYTVMTSGKNIYYMAFGGYL
jgi:hypothetical protein